MANDPNLRPLLLAYLDASLNLLRTSLEHARSGQPAFYRVAALQMRLLLCDSARRHEERVDISLAPRLFPNLALPALDNPGTLLLAVWLEQEIEPGLTVHQLIRQVCDQDGGAHVDVRPIATVRDISARETLVLRLGEIVLAALVERLKEPWPVDKKSG